MNLKKVAVFGLVVVMVAFSRVVCAEEAVVTEASPEADISNQQAALEKESDIQWAWGEVMNLDNQAGTVTLKYLDYETDQEKELVLVIDEKTTFENINDFGQLKPGDALSIDYTAGADNKNIAKNISFEKTDASSSALAEENSELVSPSFMAEQPEADVSQPVASLEVPVDASAAAIEAPSSPVEPTLNPALAVPESIPAVQE